MLVLTVVGARPQFVKAAAVSRPLRHVHEEYLVHTGQHYDADMSDVFFRELGIPAPDVNLEIGSGAHGAQTGAMLAALEDIMVARKPDWVLVYGDTNSTLAGALAAAKLHIPVAHVEAGVRSFNWRMPEEINRVLTDAAADLLLAPTQTALAHLSREGVHGRIAWVGDVMLDVLDGAAPALERNSAVRDRLGFRPGEYYAATLHRAENVDEPASLEAILAAMRDLDRPVVLPLHPRTRRRISEFGLERYATPNWISPLGYFDMLALVRQSAGVLTDSGGLQKEAAFLGVPCVTLREQTEWPETVEHGCNRLAGADRERILSAVADLRGPNGSADLRTYFGGARASGRIVDALSLR
ncbi:MAG: UDP-N-acetylglucosamine 2-epimerase (non-hydrolyzing) [Candidatus Sericytochromatia bacterium]|nr:UDP-N-acetylglucosamine 2-epimerase (non-hydrolyzing) [Candidatus Tanganyikabacteria bacterium]